MLLSPHEPKYVDVAQNNSSRCVEALGSVGAQSLPQDRARGSKKVDGDNDGGGEGVSMLKRQGGGVDRRELSADTPYDVMSGSDSSNESGGE